MSNRVKETLDFVVNSSDYPRYAYMTLDRCRADCKFYLGYGNRRNECLYMGNPRDQIDFMKALWRHLEEKPEWLTIEQIAEYESKMISRV